MCKLTGIVSNGTDTRILTSYNCQNFFLFLSCIHERSRIGVHKYSNITFFEWNLQKKNMLRSILNERLISVILFFALVYRIFECSAEIEVNISQGILKGIELKLINGKTIKAFLGVPYARPPVFEYRFKEPQELLSWNGVWNGSEFTRFCIQYNNLLGMVVGEEDCLYLNIFAPYSFKKAVAKNELMDVVVWFHGGSFIQGSANFLLPEYLMANHDVVFVGVNYRLGPFGFLSTDDDEVPGNNGLKDQVLALKWVKKNIKHFGGNSESVTIAGSSAGGSSVHFHILSTMSQGLFQKAIMHSGTSLQPWLLQGKTVHNVTKNHAVMLGCPIKSSREMIECLRQRPAVRIAALNRDTMIWRHIGLQYGPVIEPVTKNNFLTRNPIDIIRTKKLQIPLLMSTTKDEGYIGLHNFIENDYVLRELDNRFNEIAPYMLYYSHRFDDDRRKYAFGNRIRDYFFQNKTIIEGENYKNLIEMLGDRLIRAYVRFSIIEHALTGSGPIYFYQFNYAGQFSLTNKYANNMKSYGASHGDDLLYVFRPQSQFHMTRYDDIQMTKFITSIWASFMKNGKPEVDIEWPSISNDPRKNGLNYLRIDSADDLRVEILDDTSAFDFWNKSLNEFPDRISNSDSIEKDEF